MDAAKKQNNTKPKPEKQTNKKNLQKI